MARTRRSLRIASLTLVALATLPAGGRADGGLSATIRRTAHGIPHIVADDYESLAFGMAYVYAQDNICELADVFVTVNADRSIHFGPDADYESIPLGLRYNNLKSDFFWQRVADDDVIGDYLAQDPPLGPLPETRALYSGYAAGYNRYLADTGVENIPDARCRGTEWVRPITDRDVYLRMYQLMIIASSGFFLEPIVDAQPPSPLGIFPEPAARAGAIHAWDGTGLPGHGRTRLGSNAIALGAEATKTGTGMMLANPHFPWEGPERFYQFHLTIPGVLDVSGAALHGSPVIHIGATRGVAWSHTVSTAWRFTPYELKLVPGDPTAYVYEGAVRHMTPTEVTVDVALRDGSVGERTHVFWDTHFGPMFEGISLGGTPAGPLNVFTWTPAAGYALRDVNAHLRGVNQFVRANHATSVRDLKAITDTYQGIPWVNTIAADSTGEAYYADHSIIPHVTDEQIADCVNGAIGIALWEVAKLPVLDGARAACEWGSDPDAVVPGIFGPSSLPILFRGDYAHNANDSYWLSNPHQPLEGFPRIIGDERAPRSLRTRIGLDMIEDRLAGTDGREGTGFSLADLQDVAFENRQYAGELWADPLAGMCEGMPAPFGVSDACPVLRAWDRHDDLDSGGAVLFRRFAERALGLGAYTVPFDPDDPMNTPSGLDTNDPRVWDAFVSSVADLRDSDMPLASTLGDYQWAERNDTRYAIHGGPGELGNFNAIWTRRGWVPGEGYPNVYYGSSFVMATSFESECPVTRTWVTYSQSTNPASPYHADQIPMFAAKQMNAVPFCEADIMADPELTVTVLE